jgi:hypothetical protein
LRTSTGVRSGRRVNLLALLAALGGCVCCGAGLGCAGTPAGKAPRPGSATPTQRPPGGHASAPSASAPSASAAPRRSAPPAARLLVSAPRHLGSGWSVVAEVRGAPAAWVAQRRGARLMRFDQDLLQLHLHAGSSDGGARGWRYGDRVSGREVHSLVAAFNGGFKLAYRDVGFSAGHHVAAALKRGLASIVTYSDGGTDIGTWRAGVPSAGRPVYSVLQNQHLLVDRGRATARAANCGQACWGETLGSVPRPARSGLGVTASGQLVWAAAEHLSPSELAGALVAGGAVRAMELDINPYWVAGYLYPHHRSGPVAVAVLPGQHGIAGALLAPDARDFLTVVAR